MLNFKLTRRFPSSAAVTSSARLVVAACVAATLLTGCKTGPGSFSDKFGVGPGDARIAHFHFSGMGMDHSYLWVIEPVDEAVIAAIVAAAKLKASRGIEDTGTMQGGSFPAWWDQDAIEQLPEGYFRDGDRQFWRVWTDRRSNRIYAQWFDT